MRKNIVPLVQFSAQASPGERVGSCTVRARHVHGDTCRRGGWVGEGVYSIPGAMHGRSRMTGGGGRRQCKLSRFVATTLAAAAPFSMPSSKGKGCGFPVALP